MKEQKTDSRNRDSVKISRIIYLSVGSLTLMICSFYFWIFQQFNSNKIEEKIQYYFVKNLPNYSLQIGEIDFRLTSKIQYELKNVKVFDQEKMEAASLGNIKIFVPLLAIIGGEKVAVEISKSHIKTELGNFKDLYFYVQSLRSNPSSINFDLPFLLAQNTLSLKLIELNLVKNDQNPPFLIENLEFKKFSLESKSVFSIQSKLTVKKSNGEDQNSDYRLYGEVNLGSLISNRPSDPNIFFETDWDGERIKFQLREKEGVNKVSVLDSKRVKGEFDLKFESFGLNFENLNLQTLDNSWIEKFSSFQELHLPWIFSTQLNVSGNAKLDLNTKKLKTNIQATSINPGEKRIEIRHQYQEPHYRIEFSFFEKDSLNQYIFNSDSFYASTQLLNEIEVRKSAMIIDSYSSLDIRKWLIELNSYLGLTLNSNNRLNSKVFFIIDRFQVGNVTGTLKAKGLVAGDTFSFENIVLESEEFSAISQISLGKTGQTIGRVEFKNLPIGMVNGLIGSPIPKSFSGGIFGMVEFEKQDKTVLRFSLRGSNLKTPNHIISQKILKVLPKTFANRGKYFWKNNSKYLNMTGVQIDDHFDYKISLTNQIKTYVRELEIQGLEKERIINLIFPNASEQHKKHLNPIFKSGSLKFKLNDQGEVVGF